MYLPDWLRPSRPKPIPATLWESTLERYDFLQSLNPDEQSRLKILAEQFLANKEFTAVGGLEICDEICVAIAAQGCLPVLEIGLQAYSDWVGIIVYPDEFVVEREVTDEDGVVHEYTDILSGETWEGGPLLVSWQDVRHPDAHYNVVIHEFAHKLDMRNGEADGIPALPTDIAVDRWKSCFFRAYENFCQRVDAGENTSIDAYGSESPEEFFAVLSETFFGMPDCFAADYPELYALFKRYYRQDPLPRMRTTHPEKPAREGRI